MMTEYTSTGMIARSLQNPLDEIPVGPQVFPYGTPTLAESRIEPYQSTNYENLYSSNNIQQGNTFPSTNYQVTNNYINNYTPIDSNVQTNIGTNYQTYNVPVTKYQSVISYKPVSKTVMVPKVINKMIPISDYEGQTSSSSINPKVQTPNPIVQQPLPPQEAFDNKPMIESETPSQPNIKAPIMPLVFNNNQSIPPNPISPIITIYNDPHFIRNYPIYENDQKKISDSLDKSSGVLENANPNGTNPSYSIINSTVNNGLSGLNNSLSGMNNGFNNINNY